MNVPNLIARILLTFLVCYFLQSQRCHLCFPDAG